MKNFLCAVVSLICLSHTLLSQNESNNIYTEKQVADILDNYYTDRNTEDICKLIRSIDVMGITEESNASPPIMGFFVPIFCDSNVNSTELKNTISKLTTSKSFFEGILKSTEKKVNALLMIEQHYPYWNDVMWGAYYSTGDNRYLAKLVSQLSFCNRTDSVMLLLTGLTAKWSLCSNAKKLPPIKEYLKSELPKSSKEINEIITDILLLSPGEIKEQMEERVKQLKGQLK